MERKRTIKSCALCGNAFYPKKDNQMYCCIRCRSIANARRTRRRQEEIYKANKAAAKANENELVRIAKLARKSGMSYGEYVGKMEYNSPCRRKES